AQPDYPGVVVRPTRQPADNRGAELFGTAAADLRAADRAEHPPARRHVGRVGRAAPLAHAHHAGNGVATHRDPRGEVRTDAYPCPGFAQAVPLCTALSFALVRRVICGLTCGAAVIRVIARWSVNRARPRVILPQLELAGAGPGRAGRAQRLAGLRRERKG